MTPEEALRDLDELMGVPLRGYLATSPEAQRRAYPSVILTMPLDLAAAGWEIQVSQEDGAWSLSAQRQIGRRRCAGSSTAPTLAGALLILWQQLEDTLCDRLKPLGQRREGRRLPEKVPA